jgi:hypothetical protein
MLLPAGVALRQAQGLEQAKRVETAPAWFRLEDGCLKSARPRELKWSRASVPPRVSPRPRRGGFLSPSRAGKLSCVKLVSAAAEIPYLIQVTSNQCLLLCNRPAFELRLPQPCSDERLMYLNKEKPDRWVDCGRATSDSGGMPRETRCGIIRASHVQCTGPKLENANKRRAPRQARGHSTCVFDEGHYVLLYS